MHLRTRRLGAALLGAAALVLTSLALPGAAPADTRGFRDTGRSAGPHDISRVVVDNTGPVVGVRVWHRRANWRGRVTVRLDSVGGPRFDHVAQIRRSAKPQRTFRRTDGRVWRCGGRTLTSKPGSRLTVLQVPRSCVGMATKLRARVDVASPQRRPGRMTTRAVAQQSRPNIVMIMLDDMRADELQYMPHTQELIADQGVTFENALSTYPLCCPARASVLTGQYTHNHRVYSHVPPWGFTSFDDSATIATRLDAAGYQTGYLGKYLNGYGSQPAPGRTRGRSTTYVPPGWDRWHASIDGGLAADHPKNGGTYRYYNTTVSDNGKGYISFESQYQTRAYGSFSSRMIQEFADQDAPFFTYLSYTAPHHGPPRQAGDPGNVARDDGKSTRIVTPAVPKDVDGRFDDVITAAPGAEWMERYRCDDPEVDPCEDRSGQPTELRDIPPLNEGEKEALLEATRQRAEAVSVVDEAVAKTIATLEATGELEETLILLTSDNGYFLGEQGIRQGKTLPYDPALKVPLVMRGPGIPEGEVRSDPFLFIDFAPTLADFAGLRPGNALDGKSMIEVARSGDTGWTRPVLTETGPSSTVRNTDESGAPLDDVADPGMRDQRYILGIRTAGYLYTDRASGDEELYDVIEDPDQHVNLIGRPAYRDTAQLLRQQLTRVRACDGRQCRVSLPAELLED